MSLLADFIYHVRLSGAIFMLGEYRAPWAFESPPSEQLRGLLSKGFERLIPFHAIRTGSAWVETGEMRHRLEVGDLAVISQASQHRVGAGVVEAIPIGHLVPPLPWSAMPVVRIDGGGERTEIVCGYFRCDEPLFNTVLRYLPPLFVVRPQGPAADFFSATMNYVLAQPVGVEAVLNARLPELLLAEALRLFSETAEAGGWLAATLDPVIGRSLALVHADPIHDWTIEELARESGTSRTVLAERFNRVLQQTPMQYLAEWRMQIAADLLRSSTFKIADIAQRVGYGSDAAFSRAFRRHVGRWPAEFRETAAT
jgi:AraC-like DNA-binding protein